LKWGSYPKFHRLPASPLGADLMMDAFTCIYRNIILTVIVTLFIVENVVQSPASPHMYYWKQLTGVTAASARIAMELLYLQSSETTEVLKLTQIVVQK
jgi:hypothetical protein